MLDLPAQLKPFSGERFLEPSLRPASLPHHMLTLLAGSGQRNWQNISALFCARAAVHRFSLVPASAPEYVSFAPFTGYKSATKDRLLLDQRGVNGQEVKLLEGSSARLPEGWQFTDLQLGSNGCFRVSESRSQSGWAASSLAKFPRTCFYGDASRTSHLARWCPPSAICGEKP